MSLIPGKYDLVEADKNNFEAYLKATGINFALRKIAINTKPRIEIELNGDIYTVRTVSTFKTHETKFKLDEDFEEETLDGRKAKSKVVKDGENKLVQTQSIANCPDMKGIREFTDKQMTLTLEVTGVKVVRVYNRIEN